MHGTTYRSYLSLFLKQDNCFRRFESPFWKSTKNLPAGYVGSPSSLQLKRKEPFEVLNNRNKIRLVYCFCLHTDRRRASRSAWGGQWVRGIIEGRGLPHIALEQWREKGRHALVKMKYIFKKGSSHQTGVMATLQGHFPLLLGLSPLPSPVLWSQPSVEGE